jgi:hypothetical protein
MPASLALTPPDATMTRTLARGLDLQVLLTINDSPTEVLDVA